MALTLAEQRKLPGYEVLENTGTSNATPNGSRRYPNKVSAIGRYSYLLGRKPWPGIHLIFSRNERSLASSHTALFSS